MRQFPDGASCLFWLARREKPRVIRVAYSSEQGRAGARARNRTGRSDLLDHGPVFGPPGAFVIFW
jgi:hypothetical protein